MVGGATWTGAHAVLRQLRAEAGLAQEKLARRRPEPAVRQCLERGITAPRTRTRPGCWLLATSLFGDVAAALREHGSATLDEHCCYFRRPDWTWSAVTVTW